ncbi:MFS transporter [Candidatus Similichlamydia epinepheli]|uniref:MFS transporter n=1 Tax=Candidatus Similichlamydia epinepheli TaxID=1903953 RepID=UPI000D3398ED|nr:MFS transporter [Candidatus Similichlamydia epinepheli]
MFWIFKSVSDRSDSIEVSKEQRSSYLAWRVRIFFSLYFGYVLFSFARCGFAFAAPLMRDQLHLQASDLGLIATSWSLLYGLGKFINGILSDRSNPRYFMAFGLLVTGICNFCFGVSSSFYLYILFWGLNGWFQGTGWPNCARCLTNWFPPKEKGRWWGLLSTSHNIAGAIVPIIYTAIGSLIGWRAIFFVPAIVSFFGAFWLVHHLREHPSSVGLPSLLSLYPHDVSSPKESDKGIVRHLFREVISSGKIWLLGCSYCFIYSLRIGLHDWLTFFFIDQKQYNYFRAGSCVLWFELGGALGGVLVGWISDVLFSGKRVPTTLLFMFFFMLVLVFLFLGGVTNYFLNSLILFFLGVSLFGPQMLVGLIATEISPSNLSGAANGFVSIFAQIGSAFAGYPFGLILSQSNWVLFFGALFGCSLMSVFCLSPILFVEFAGKEENQK